MQLLFENPLFATDAVKCKWLKPVDRYQSQGCTCFPSKYYMRSNYYFLYYSAET